MGMKKISNKLPLFNASVMTGTATLTSASIPIGNFDNSGIQLSWTGTPTGTISVLVSNDGSDWDPLTFDPVLIQPAGSAGKYGINLNQVPFPFVQLQYVNVSGTGTLTATIFSKDLN